MAFVALLTLAQSDPAGTAEQLAHYRLARSYDKPDAVDAAIEAAGLASPKFETRYVAALMKVHRVFASGRGYDAIHRMLLSMSPDGGPRGAAAHLTALAESVKKAASCGDCKDGRVSCGPCQGIGKRDVACPKCDGKGRHRPTGVVNNANVTVKCRNCDGEGKFKNTRCPECAGSGKNKCGACDGACWRKARCAEKDCRAGRVACGPCKGAGTIKSDCPDCENGRFRPAGAVGGANVTVKCRKCEKPNGDQGDGSLSEECKKCSRSGRVSCKTCGGTFANKDKTAPPDAIPVSAVFSVEKCAACLGAGWPNVKVAVPCTKCFGLGGKVLPASDASRVLQ